MKWSGRSAAILLAVTPLLMSTWTTNAFQTPKFAFLLALGMPVSILLAIELVRRRAWLSRDLFGWMLFLRWVSITVSSVLSLSPSISFFGDPGRCYGWLSRTLILSVAGALYVGYRGGEVPIHRILKAVAAAGFPISLYALLQSLHLDPLRLSLPDGRPCSTLGNAAFLADAEQFILFISMALALQSKTLGQRILWSASGCLAAVGIASSLSRAGWLACAAGMATLAWIGLFRKWRRLAWIGLCVSCLGLAALGIGLAAAGRGGAAISGVAGILGKDPTGTGRRLIWGDTLSLIRDRGLWGCGLECFAPAFLPHRSLGLARFNPSARYDNAHNELLTCWATEGALGLLSYVGLCSVAFWSLWPGLQARRLSLASMALFPAFVAHLANGLFSFDTLATGLMWYGLCGLAAGSRRASDVPSPPSGPLWAPVRWGMVAISGLLGCALACRILLADHEFSAATGFLISGDPVSALPRAEKAQRCVPWSGAYAMAVADARFGQALVSKGQEEARRALKEAGEICETLVRDRMSIEPELALEKLIQCQGILGDVSGAEQTLSKLLVLDPWSSVGHVLGARVFRAKGDLRKALSLAEEARALDPWNGETMALEEELSEALRQMSATPLQDIAAPSFSELVRFGTGSESGDACAGVLVQGGPLDGFVCVEAQSDPAPESYFPIFRNDGVWQTDFVVCNPEQASCSASWTVLSAEGAALRESSMMIQPGAIVPLPLNPAPDLSEAWIRLKSTAPVLTWAAVGLRAGPLVCLSPATPTRTAGLPAVPSSLGWWTGLALANPHESPVRIKLRSNAQLRGLSEFYLPAGGKRTLGSNELAGLNEGSWLFMEADEPILCQGIVGRRSERILSACGLSDLSARREASFPVFGCRYKGSCRLIAANPDPNRPAHLLVQSLSESASNAQTHRFEIPASSSVDLAQRLPAATDLGASVISDIPLFFLELIEWNSGPRRGIIASAGARPGRELLFPLFSDGSQSLVFLLPGQAQGGTLSCQILRSDRRQSQIQRFFSVGRCALPLSLLF